MSTEEFLEGLSIKTLYKVLFEVDKDYKELLLTTTYEDYITNDVLKYIYITSDIYKVLKTK